MYSQSIVQFLIEKPLQIAIDFTNLEKKCVHTTTILDGQSSIIMPRGTNNWVY